MRYIKFKQEKELKNMTSININKEKFGQLIHKEKPVLLISGHLGVVIAVELERLMKK